MRQKKSPEDLKLRKALENMRYKSCTKDDIMFLRSRIASDREGHPHLDSVVFRDVSVITAWNVHKDTINELGADRFAADTNQELVEFFSVDRLNPKSLETAGKWKNHNQAHLKRISQKLQDQLWKAAPSSTSEHVSGCLKLCVGMPIMIKSNEATELCITKGQEATVRGWNDVIAPNGKRVLETLFVELTNPPRPIQIADLPVNVVPLPRSTTTMTTLLQDDSVLAIARDQVLVLPNFSMTDYGAQGKSRPRNVVHLNNCKNHMGYYVCLSRGTEAATTAIIQGFEERVITGGLSGHMRQEFRELEMLDEITRLKEAKQLPPSVTGIYRGQLLASFRKWKKNEPDPPHFHPAIKYNARLDKNIQYQTVYDAWRATGIEDKDTVGNKRRKPDTTSKSRKKQKSEAAKEPMEVDGEQLTNNISKAGGDFLAASSSSNANNRINEMPMGLIWDSVNWSCSYDSILTPLGHLWRSDREKWGPILSGLHPLWNVWCQFMASDANQPEIARNNMRRLLHYADPVKFPLGARCVSLDNLLGAVSSPETYATAILYCEQCRHVAPGEISTLSMLLVAYRIQEFIVKPTGTQRCSACNSNRTRRRTIRLKVPPILLVSVQMYGVILLDAEMQFGANGVQETLRLAGITYFSPQAQHFTSITATPDGSLWYHDGISTGRRCNLVGNINTIDKTELQKRGDYVIGCAIYVRK
ncbi:hypothetical protein B0H16DRAFT_1328687 [Mycena metata]|uniref:Uncharacterized protein n=1 Tax=Mycena metata TaxID=1033252 RepID=A0AAD7I0W6_9AGAR|nr:hypothetical protein B0H16DRAFT_1328687 [Mycena metata]